MTDINATTTVRDLLQAHPSVVEVLIGHGMCEGCKADPPPVPLGHFATKHCEGNIGGLIEEINTVIAKV